MKIETYAAIIASRYDGIMYLATLWAVINSDGDVAISERILIENIRAQINKALGLRGWSTGSSDEIISEEDYQAYGTLKGDPKKWLESLKDDKRELIARSIVTDIYRMIWKDGKFSVGEKKAISEIVGYCGVSADIANWLCLCVGMTEYYAAKVRETVESGRIVSEVEREKAKKVGEGINARAKKKGEKDAKSIMLKAIAIIAAFCIGFNFYALYKYGKNAELVRNVAEIARCSDRVITETECEEIRKMSALMGATCSPEVLNSIVLNDAGCTNNTEKCTSNSRDNPDVVRQIVNGMLAVAVADDNDIDAEESKYVIRYLVSNGFTNDAHRVGGRDHRCFVKTVGDTEYRLDLNAAIERAKNSKAMMEKAQRKSDVDRCVRF